KKEQLPWVFSFLTDEIGLDPNKIYVTVFAGDEKNNIPRDTESANLWKEIFTKKGISAKDVELITEENGSKVGMQGGRIFYYNSAKNWWSRSGTPEKMPKGEPGGPDSEMFYEFSDVNHDTKFGEKCHPNCDCGRYLEIGNSVFMEYVKDSENPTASTDMDSGTPHKFSKLAQKNVDFGGGLERIAMASINTADIFAIDVFADIISELENKSGKKYSDPAYTPAFRVIADHLRSSTFLIGDGVLPGNIDQGYFVRRLIRRAVSFMDKLEIKTDLSSFVEPLLAYYKDSYPETFNKAKEIADTIKAEEDKFRKTLSKGNIEFSKMYKEKGEVDGQILFDLFTSHGFPMELSLEIAKELNYKIIEVAKEKFVELMDAHRKSSRSGSEQKFKGGLADASDMVIKYHTATHLLHQALHEVLGDAVSQKGSNITSERLRFDFAHGAKMTDDEKKKVEDIVNARISESLPVQKVILPKNEAENLSARHFFADKYGDSVSIYFIGKEIVGENDSKEKIENAVRNAYSKEFCGGPHVKNTGELSTAEGKTSPLKFKIQKEEAVSAGVRRIKAVLI
ncbi:MAG: alanine--tRNA ligase-related protein, partial [bacterium]|nr:alanine--tRNA ligase-related protein [bacterium]